MDKEKFRGRFHNAFWRGLASVFDGMASVMTMGAYKMPGRPGPHLQYKPRAIFQSRALPKPLTPRQAWEADKKALASDWQRIGGYFPVAIRKAEQKTKQRR